MDFRIELSGHHAEDSSVGFRGLCDRFVSGLRDAGYTVTGSTYNWHADDPAQGKPTEQDFDDAALVFGSVEPEDAVEIASLAGIDFASDNSAELAADLGLVASDFDGREPSGKGGYTSRDVRRAAK